MFNAHARRDALNADCVVLLTAGDYDNALGLTPSCGPSEARAFSIVQIEAAGPWTTFTHELGHQFGCKHSPNNSNGSCEPDFERPHSFRCGGRDRYTVMEAGVPKKKDRVPHFSNPDVKYHDHPTGTKANATTGEVDKDNVRQLREKACEVAAYRISNDLSAYVSLQKINADNRYEVLIGASDLPTGTYLLRVTSGDNTQLKKVNIVH